jgi:hypothetical protein
MHARPFQTGQSEASIYPKRFSWPMRLFLSVLLFCMIYRSFAVLFPMEPWYEEYAVEPLPAPLPTAAERMKLLADANTDNPHPLRDRYGHTAISLLNFFVPWPGAETREQIESPLDAAKVAACWLDSRLDFLERLLAVQEQWAMFSEGIDHEKHHARARLYFDDGSTTVVRLRAEPEDLTQYRHWFEERVINHEGQVPSSIRAAHGYCNLVAHRDVRGPKGARLVKIVVFKVEVRLAPPGVDARAHYQMQNHLVGNRPELAGDFRLETNLAGKLILPDYYEFDVDTRQGRWLGGQSP